MKVPRFPKSMHLSVQQRSAYIHNGQHDFFFLDFVFSKYDHLTFKHSELLTFKKLKTTTTTTTKETNKNSIQKQIHTAVSREKCKITFTLHTLLVCFHIKNVVLFNISICCLYDSFLILFRERGAHCFDIKLHRQPSRLGTVQLFFGHIFRLQKNFLEQEGTIGPKPTSGVQRGCLCSSPKRTNFRPTACRNLA